MEKPRRTRTGKNVAVDRNFVCECGKKYLSRGALAAHQKSKHRPETGPEKAEEEPRALHLQNKRIRKVKSVKTSKMRVREYKKLLKRYLAIIPEAEVSTGTDAIADFPEDLFAAPEVYQSFLFSLKNIENVIKPMNSEEDNASISNRICATEGLDKLGVDDAAALFCYYIADWLSKDFYKECVAVLVGFTRMLKAEQRRIDANGELIDELPPSLRSTRQIKPAHIPEYANQYLMDCYIPLVSTTDVLRDPSKLKFFGLEDVHIFRAFLVVYLFAKWLYTYKLTKLKLDKFK